MAIQKKSQTTRLATARRKTKDASLPLLIEIGTEEIPTTFFPQALEDLAAIGRQLLAECRLDYDKVRTVGTCRRLALLVDGVQTRQRSVTRKVTGPPKSAAFDAFGTPTKAAEGFAKSQGVSVEQLVVTETPKGLYLAVEKHEKGQPAKQVLMAKLPEYVAKLNFPKAMRWNASQAKFARPIRWMAVLLGPHALRIEFAGIRSSSVTWGHRYFRARGQKTGQGTLLANAASYVMTMRKLGVVVDPAERRALILRQISALAKSAKGSIDPVHRDALVEEAVWSVEHPHAVLGSFGQEFLTLPKPVLTSSMKEHQGFFSLAGKDGALLPRFITVTNMPWGNTALIRKGNERVLAARLNDAQYFFNEDVKQSLHQRVSALDEIMFHQQLGTVRQKVERVRNLVGWLTVTLGREDLKDGCERAALLAKADLTTGMVGEFPTLQGIMGQEYAKHDGEPLEVCQAIGEHYFPRFPDDPVPQSLPGQLLACADRCDSIASFFAVGMSPSGSEDPLGLRRAAYGLVRIVSEASLGINLVDMFTHLIQILNQQGVAKEEANTLEEIMNFMMDRLCFYGRNTLGLRDDVMAAVTGVWPRSVANVGDLLARMQALQAIVSQSDFEMLMIGFKRAHRIVEKEGWTDMAVNPEQFRHDTEHGLLRALEAAQHEVSDYVAKQQYHEAFCGLLTLKSPIDEFFEAVLVNDPDPQIRKNRLSLLTVTDQLFLTLADLSCIQYAGIEAA